MNTPATLNDLQSELHSFYEGNTSTPAVSSDDWNLRTLALNRAIRTWEHADGFLWPELMVTNFAGGTADGTTTSFALPDDFAALLGSVFVTETTGESKYNLISADRIQQYIVNPTDTLGYITGTPGAQILNFTIAPVSGALHFDYLKTATQLANTTDTTECPDPDFLVYLAASELLLADTNYGAANDAASKANDRMSRMKAMALGLPTLQPNTIPIGGASFGE